MLFNKIVKILNKNAIRIYLESFKKILKKVLYKTNKKHDSINENIIFNILIEFRT